MYALVGPERAADFAAAAARTRQILGGRAVINVNSTASGGGVAELLQTLLAYARGTGVATRWLVIEGNPDFFTITKRVHNHLYGTAGDGQPLDARARDHYEATLAPNAAALTAAIDPGDVVLLHDPQTAGMVPALQRAGIKVVWRCHVGCDTANEFTERAWSFLAPYLESVEAFVFTRADFAPAWTDADRLHVITPSIDPFSAKNAEFTDETARRILDHVGLFDADCPGTGLTFTYADGSPGHVAGSVDTLGTGHPPPDRPLVTQLSRWDSQKDMIGVLRAFARHVSHHLDAHLLLTGPSVVGVDDDPEGGAVLAQCLAEWADLPGRDRARVHLASVPMGSAEHAATIANAIQRHSTIVAQKSLAEGFGLTVSEAMWKHRPVVATRVGGIVDQIDDSVHGLLLDDPEDLPGFGAMVEHLLAETPVAQELGERAYTRVFTEFLGDRHLEKYAQLLEALLT